MDTPSQTVSSHSSSSSQSMNGWYKATVYRRFAAVFIDGLILFPIFLIMSFVGNAAHMTWINSLEYILGPVYAVVMIWKYGATLGKKVMKVKVVRTNGQPLNLIQAFLREVVGKWISGAILGIGYFWAFWDGNRQALHDKIAGTYVMTSVPNSNKNGKATVVLGIFGAVITPILVVLAIALVGLAAFVAIQSRATTRLAPLPANINETTPGVENETINTANTTTNSAVKSSTTP